jgi:hypothetical protein
VIGTLYLEHLTDADLSVLAAARDGRSLDDRRSELLREPDRILTALDAPAVFDALFGGDGREAFLQASPFLAFATLVHRAAQNLKGSGFVQEWVGPKQRVPVFDVSTLRDFAGDPFRRLFLAELLASYTHVSSGSIIFRTGRGWRRRRFSELDPLRLIELLDLVPAADRPLVYRRLGDLALFLSGVFPDYAGSRLLPPVARQRLDRALSGMGAPEPSLTSQPSDALALLERVGAGAYLAARRGMGGQGRGTARVLRDVAGDGFGTARRILNFVTDQYLFPLRHFWFPSSDS